MSAAKLVTTAVRVSMAVALTAALSARQGPTPEPSQRFRVRTAAVSVDVVVRDKHHQPMTGLLRNDFEILEDNEPQEITSFEAVTGSASAPVSGESTSATPSAVAQRLSTMVPSVVALVFEQLSATGRTLASQAALRFIDQSMHPGDLGGVFTVDRALEVQAPYTTDRPSLRRGVHAAAVRAGMPLERAGRVPGAEFGSSEPGQPSNATKYESPYARAHATFDAVERLMASMRSMRGRKAILLFSEGLASGAPKDSDDFHATDNWMDDNRWDHFQRLLQQANRDEVAFYTFDAHGLRIEGDPQGFGEAPYVALEMLADETGGAFVQATNDLTPGVIRVGADLRSYYLLGYISKKPPDNRYRRITVKVKRRGVAVLARKGYYAAMPSP